MSEVTDPPGAEAAPPASEEPAPEPLAPADSAALAGPLAAPVQVPPPPSAPAMLAPPADLALLRRRPSFLFFGIVASLSLFADVMSKAWAEISLSRRTMLDPAVVLVKNHLSLTLAYNKGGAWGLLHDASENVRRPFFLLVSVLAIAFIVSLYSRLGRAQRALKWGLPFVLGGALGNLSDRITRSSVIDFIDFRADWIEKMNALIARSAKGWTITDHWPTFNVADVFICVGVALMAVDMVTSRRKPRNAPAATPPSSAPPPAPDASSAAG